MATRFSALRAGERATALLDHKTFIPLREIRSDSPFVVGSGTLGGVRVLVLLIDGHVHGGTIGVEESTALIGLAHRLAPLGCRWRPPGLPLILGFDTGGVRVQGGPRALAAASALGVALARMTLLGVRAAAIISGPRGCFGAPAVMAALPEYVVMTADAHWGLTGPKILRGLADTAAGQDGYEVTSAAMRLQNGDAHAVVADTAQAVRGALLAFVAATAAPLPPQTLDARIAASAAVTATLRARLCAAGPRQRSPRVAPVANRRRDLLRYTLRGQWTFSGPLRREGLVQAALGTFGGAPVLSVVVGPEPTAADGVGIEEAAICTALLHEACPQRAAILTFLFCQGHAVDAAQERFGLPRALAECLRAMVATRLRGQPIVSVLGGGTYGAAYLAFAAPSHRILAIRGTSVAPMAPRVLRAFQALRGAAPSGGSGQGQLAELIPDIRIVESVIRLPRVVRDEMSHLLATVRPEIP